MSARRAKIPTLPASVVIGGKRVKIKVRNLDTIWGLYDHDGLAITLNRELLSFPEKLRDTLWHEMVEATLYISGVAWSKRYEQEPIVRALEEIFKPAWDRIHPRLP